MLTIDWTQAPEWANFAVMDEDGEWLWHEKEPLKNLRGDWMSGGIYKVIATGCTSLIKRPTSTTSPATLNNMDNY